MTRLQSDGARANGRRGLVPATLTERFFGRAAFVGFPFQIYLDTTLGGPLDAPALATALRRAIADHPRLLVRLAPASRALRRWMTDADTLDAAALIRRHDSSATLDARRGDMLDLSAVGPVRLELCEQHDGTRLVIVLHHAMTDAQGALTFYDRLAARYAEALGGAPAPALTEPVDARRRRMLRGAPLRTRLAAVGSVLSPIREMLPGARPRPAARFHDRATLDGSEMRTLRVTVPPAIVASLVRAAARRTASITDVLVTAATVAARDVWPQPDDAPIGLDVPVNLRETDGDVADHAGPFRFRVPADVARDFDATLAAVSEQTRIARTRIPSVIQSLGVTVPSYLPPKMFDGAVGGFLRANPTGGDSMCVSNVGALTGRLRDFGPVPLLDVGVYANSPGLRLMIVPSPRGLSLTFSYFSPLIDDAKVARVAAAAESRLAAFASARA